MLVNGKLLLHVNCIWGSKRNVMREKRCIFMNTFVVYKYEPRREKTGFLHMRKQRRRSASR